MGLVRSASDDLLYAGVGGVPAGASVVWVPVVAGRGARRAGPVVGCCRRPLVCGAGCWRLLRVVLSGGVVSLRGCRGGSVGGAVGGCILGYLVIGFVASLAELGNKLFGTS